MKKALLTTAALSVIAMPAMAADLAPIYKAPPPAFPGWTGFYIGGTVGGIFTENSVDVTTTNTFVNTGALSPLGQTTGPASAVAATGSIPTAMNGVIGGFEAGYNWQLAPTWVLGLEADIQGISTLGAAGAIVQVAPRTGFPGDNFTASLSATEKLDWLGTVRGRLGYLITPTWLIYGTGGLAYGGASSSTLITGGETPNTGSTNIAGAGAFSGTRIGWTAGLGAEYMFAPNWTVKTEWLHYDLGSATYSNGTMSSFLNGTNVLNFTDSSSSTAKFSGDIVRGGINYRF